VIRLVLHHVRKDLRAVRPWLLLWLALLVANVVCLVPAVDLAFRRASPRSEQFIWWTYLLSAARVLLGMVLTVRVIHADAPAGTTAFWFTRPLTSRTVLIAKLVTILGLVGLAAAASVAGLLLNALEPAAAPAALVEVALFEAVPLLPLAVVASLTRDAARLVLAALACFGIFLAGRLTAVAAAAYGHDNRVGVGVVLLGAIVVVFSLWCLAAQYLSRRPRRTGAVAALALLLMAAVGFIAPFRPAPPAVTRAWPSGATVSATLTSYTPLSRAGVVRRHYAMLELRGLPPGIVVRPQSVDGTLRFQDGHEQHYRVDLWSGASTIRGRSAFDRQVGAAAADVLQAAVLHADDREDWFMRLPLVDIASSEVLARQETPARYEGSVKLIAYRLRLAALLPMTAGASTGFASRHLAVVSGPGRDDGAHVWRVRLTAPALDWRPAGEVECLLLNRSRGEALPGHYRARYGRLEQQLALYLWAPIADLAFPYRAGGNRRLDEAWFDGSELAVLSIEEEGSFSVKVTMDEVTVR